MTDEQDDGEYRVGYRRPPRHTQFKPGQSGNKKGRPKRSNALKTDVLKTLRTPVTVTDASGRRRTVSTQAGILLKLREQAVKGDARAIDRIIALASIHNGDDPAIATAASLSAEDRDIVDAFVARQTNAVPRAQPKRPIKSEDLDASVDKAAAKTSGPTTPAAKSKSDKRPRPLPKKAKPE